MKKTDAFSDCHPIVNITYFLLVIGFTMIIMHPICLAISLLCAMAYAIYLKGQKAIRFNIIYMIPLLLITALVNPVFSHRGVTILAYLPGGNPLTLESILYGVTSAMLLICTITWFSSFNKVMTSDRIVYVFGRFIPSLSLVLSMSLRFIPRFINQMKFISNAQRCIGYDMQKQGLLKKVRYGIKRFSMLTTWALENAIDTADSMNSRGYGLTGRTSFSIYRFDKRDKKLMVFLLFMGISTIVAILTKRFYFQFYPMVTKLEFSFLQVGLFLIYFLLCATPIILNVKEYIKWKKLQTKPLVSKI
jgi:ABC-type cobalt transport system, permease component CbiQ and related transporters